MKGPLDAEYISSSSHRHWSWRRLEIPGWKLLTTAHFVIRSDARLKKLRQIARMLERVFEMLGNSLGGDQPDGPATVRIFAKRPDFQSFASRHGASNAESMYDPRTAEMALTVDGDGERDWLSRTLAHEATHQYMDRVWGCTSPLWFAEGMAEYFAGFMIRKGRAYAGLVDQRALLLMSLDRPVPLYEFLAMERNTMYGPRFRLLYAQAWSVVHFLFSRRDETITRLLRGEDLADIDQVEEGWKAHIKELGQVRLAS